MSTTHLTGGVCRASAVMGATLALAVTTVPAEALVPFPGPVLPASDPSADTAVVEHVPSGVAPAPFAGAAALLAVGAGAAVTMRRRRRHLERPTAVT